MALDWQGSAKTRQKILIALPINGKSQFLHVLPGCAAALSVPGGRLKME